MCVLTADCVCVCDYCVFVSGIIGIVLPRIVCNCILYQITSVVV